MNWLLIKRIHSPFSRYPKHLLFFSRIRLDFTIKYANSLWILYRLNASTMNSFSHWRIHFEFTICYTIYIFFGNTLLILYFFANLLWIRFHLREFTTDSPSFSRNLYGYIILANLLWLHYLFRELIINSLFYRWYWLCFLFPSLTFQRPFVTFLTSN